MKEDKIHYLEETIRLLEHGWTTGAFARDKDGIECSELSDDAVSFCLIGALTRAANNTRLDARDRHEIQMFVSSVASLFPYLWADQWNDAQVSNAAPISLLRRALAHVERDTEVSS